MDRAERLIRAARPADEPLSARAEADLTNILASDPVQRDHPGTESARHHHPGKWVWAAAAAVLVAATLVGMSLFRPVPAYAAATPPMLTITPVPGDAASILGTLQTVAAAQPDRLTQGTSTAIWWALSSDVDQNGTITSSFVEPRRRVSTIGPDGITGYTDYAAQPYDTRGLPVTDPALPAVGTQLETGTIEPEGRAFTGRVPTEATAFGKYLADTLESHSDSPAVTALSDITSLLTERILNPKQTAAAIGYLATLPDIQVLGSATDRLGRRVLVFSSPVDNDHQTLLVLSPDTGAFAASETIYRGTQRTDIPNPAVVSYTAWDAP